MHLPKTLLAAILLLTARNALGQVNGVVDAANGRSRTIDDRSENEPGAVRTVRYLQSNQASKRSIGSASALQGRVLLYHIFASDPDSVWSDDEKERVRERMKQACDFLQRESERHGHRLEFAEEYAADVRHSETLPTDSLANPSWTENVIVAASGVSGESLVRRLRKTHGVDQVSICLHIDKPALSYNLAFYKNVSQPFAAERMICFSFYPDMRPTAAATYAHEILHLFGAGDLYFPYDSDASRKDVARRMFPHDIMYRVDYDITRLYVGPFTAYRVGWRNQLDPEHRVFED